MAALMYRAWAMLLMATLPGCALVGGAALPEAVELATMGSERPLRDPPRPARGTTRVLLFALDGVGSDDLERALREGRMPHLAALLGPPAGETLFAHAYAAPGALSVLPSTTAAAWASLFTGEPPARTGVPGNEWFVREEGRLYAPVPTGVRDRTHALRQYSDELMSDLLRAPTLYERVDLRAHVSLHPVFRGADLLTVPNLATFGDLFEELVEGAARGGSSRNPGVFRETDQASVRSAVGAIRRHGVPDLQVVYFPGIDLLTHLAQDPLESQQGYLAAVTDSAIGAVLDAYREAGALQRTFVVVVADHGHTPVPADPRHALGADGPDEPPALLEQAGFRVRPVELSTRAEDFQAVLAYQGAMAFVYLADRSTCPEAKQRCDWARPARLEEDVLPVVRAFHQASETGEGMPALRGTLDLVLAREPRPVGEDALPFQVWDGRRLVPIAEYLQRHPRPELLRLEERLAGLAAGPHGHRAGDVLLIARSSAEIPLDRRFYFGQVNQSQHGSAHAQDSHIPLVVAHPARSGTQLRQLVHRAVGASPSQLDVTRLVEALLREP